MVLKPKDGPGFVPSFSCLVEEGDLKILNGQFRDFTVRQLWAKDAEGRDYIFKHFAGLGDEFLQSVLKSLLCN